MDKRLNKTEKKIIDNLDRLLAGQSPQAAESFLEVKIFQALKRAEISEEKLLEQQKKTTRLLSDLSHQLKTPLAALSLHLELAGDAALTPEEQTATLQECREQADKIRFLTEAMLKVSRLESGLIAVRREQADFCQTVRQAAEAPRAAALQKGLSFSLLLPETLSLPHDPVWTMEAVGNLLDNAVKYTQTGGITVQLERGPIYTRLDVCDTGSGMPKADYGVIFSRFYRGQTERIPGTGLGLTIAREILRQQSGNITVEATEDGAVFSVFLQNC